MKTERFAYFWDWPFYASNCRNSVAIGGCVAVGFPMTV